MRLLTLALLLPAFVCAQPAMPDRAIDARDRAAVIENLVNELKEAYVFPDVADKMAADVQARLERKEYERVTSAKEFAKLLTDQLRAISHDKHLGVRYSAEPIPERKQGAGPPPQEIERQRAIMAWQNYGFEKLERLPGNLGYLDLRGFMAAAFGAETAVAAMNFLADSNALIIDLRRNGGGDPAMVALITTYLYGPDEVVHLNDLFNRRENSTHQWWTLPYVPGKRLGGKDVYILTSTRTFSAAEEFCYNLKNRKRAVIIGETTGGGAHPTTGRRLHPHFMAAIPFARAINPVSKTNWEGTGVEPDVKVPAEQALKTAQKMALEKLLAAMKEPLARRDLEEALKNLE